MFGCGDNQQAPSAKTFYTSHQHWIEWLQSQLQSANNTEVSNSNWNPILKMHNTCDIIRNLQFQPNFMVTLSGIATEQRKSSQEKKRKRCTWSQFRMHNNSVPQVHSNACQVLKPYPIQVGVLRIFWQNVNKLQRLLDEDHRNPKKSSSGPVSRRNNAKELVNQQLYTHDEGNQMCNADWGGRSCSRTGKEETKGKGKEGT